MSQSARRYFFNALILAGIVGAHAPINAADQKKEPTVASATAGTKPPITIKKGDYELTIGGKTSIEGFFQRNVYLLNATMPDENSYVKHKLDLIFDFAFGKERYGYKAVEASTTIGHKGVWGKLASFADRESSPVGPSSIRLGDSIFGAHAHDTGRPIIYIKEGWLQFCMNAAVGSSNNHLQFLKLGWFPYELGRGIALGGYFGLNKEFLGLYSYNEDKSSPGILLTGEIVKGRLNYDLYYTKFEDRGKGLSDTFALVRKHIIGRRDDPWRGLDKNDDLIASRLKWHALKDGKAGNLDLEPYVFYNMASDQRVEIAPDAKTNWGSYGLALEHTYKAFEWGGEVALNYGKEKLFKIDRNVATIINDGTGYFKEQFTHVFQDVALTNPAEVTFTADPKNINGTREAVYLPANLSKSPFTVTPANPGDPATLFNASNRIREAYTNKFGGWMGVIDAAYTIKDLNLKLAIAYGYASGDANPHDIEKDKTYKGFVGIHEMYAGKRVPSILLLGERFTYRPTSVDANHPKAYIDPSFSDLHHLGFGATWTPKVRVRDLNINPNTLLFWKDSSSSKVDHLTGKALPNTKASSFLGSEFNLVTSCTVLPDLTLFAQAAAFLPGSYFTDVQDVRYKKNAFGDLISDPRNDYTEDDIAKYHMGLGHDVAYYVNIGFEYKF